MSVPYVYENEVSSIKYENGKWRSAHHALPNEAIYMKFLHMCVFYLAATDALAEAVFGQILVHKIITQ